jgi:hypothetical protein
VIAQGGASTPECPGTAKSPSAARGHLCLYTGYGSGSPITLEDTRDSGSLGATPFGAGVEAVAPSGSMQGDFYGARGTWAVRAK